MESLGIDIGGSSVKIAMLCDGREIWTAKSESYVRADRQKLIDSIREAASGRSLRADSIGLCVPGILDELTRTITLALNVPGLTGAQLDELLNQAGPSGPGRAQIINDAHAAAFDFLSLHKASGRLLALAIGTGVGAAVLDDGVPLFVDGNSPGHIGQIDLGGQQLEAIVCGKSAPPDDQLAALAHGLRICHAIYRPHHIALLGGIGIRLRPHLDALRLQVNRNLTSIAREDWQLHAGDDDFHAARGAARIAMRSASP